MRPEETFINKCVNSYLRSGAIFRTIGHAKAVRKILAWGYRMDVVKGRLKPIEQYEGKAEYWEEALKFNLTRDERIEVAKGLYFLMSKVEE